MILTHAECHALRDLVDELIAATDDHIYWLGPVRDTSLELRELLTSHDSAESPLVEPIWANWECPVKGCRFASITPMDHPCPLR
ncbi:hypothetical protein F4561_005086 [Lipingzhangella halophila]|uniref:Uncharacterized protein n=1 Tax=Lipingzhangella halophila TaxID=1783352 RepID=A0A7W7RLP2_9ACTN|nr:hypothetical protein [Lipingzhangella halophila]MBB4934266.1 hypothetical protein [Lipingzhangella halophila]